MRPAARITDIHTCPLHGGGPVLVGEATVFIGFVQAARMGDSASCVGAPDAITEGESSVLIGDKPAARMGDVTAHGGVIAAGCPTVLIGSSAQADTLRTNKPFCEQ